MKHLKKYEEIETPHLIKYDMDDVFNATRKYSYRKDDKKRMLFSDVGGGGHPNIYPASGVMKITNDLGEIWELNDGEYHVHKSILK